MNDTMVQPHLQDLANILTIVSIPSTVKCMSVRKDVCATAICNQRIDQYTTSLMLSTQSLNQHANAGINGYTCLLSVHTYWWFNPHDSLY